MPGSLDRAYWTRLLTPMTRPSHLGPVDGYALDDGFDDKFFDRFAQTKALPS